MDKSINILPIEILEKILNFLNLKDRCSAVLVSRSWYKAGCHFNNIKDINVTFTRSRFKDKQLPSFLDILNLLSTSHRIGNVTFYDFPIGNQPTVIASCQTCGYLLLDTTNKAKKEMLNLISLNIGNDCFDGSDIFDGKNLALILRRCSKLRKLTFGYCDSVFDSKISVNYLDNAPICSCNNNYLSHNEYDPSQTWSSYQYLNSLQHLKMCLSGSELNPHFDFLLRHAPNLQKLTIYGLTIEDLDDKKDKLTISHIIESVLIMQYNLISITINRVVDDHTLERLSSCSKINLEKAYFINCPKITDEGIINFVSKQRNIKKFKLLSCENVTDYSLGAITKYLRNLKELNLDQTKVTCGPDSNCFPPKKPILDTEFPQINKLSLKYCDLNNSDLWMCNFSKCLINIDLSYVAMDDEWISVFSTWFPNLQELYLDCTKIAWKGFKSISENLQHLRVFQLSGCKLTPKDALLEEEIQYYNSNCKFKSLTQFILSFSEDDDDWFSVFSTWVPNLQELHLHQTKIAAKGVKAIFENLHELRVLSLSGCHLITDDMLPPDYDITDSESREGLGALKKLRKFICKWNDSLKYQTLFIPL